MWTCGCLNDRVELKEACEYTDFDAAGTALTAVCGLVHEGDAVAGSISGVYPPFGKRGAFAHEHSVAAFWPRPNRGSENFHYVGERAETALVVAHGDVRNAACAGG